MILPDSEEKPPVPTRSSGLPSRPDQPEPEKNGPCPYIPEITVYLLPAVSARISRVPVEKNIAVLVSDNQILLAGNRIIVKAHTHERHGLYAAQIGALRSDFITCNRLHINRLALRRWRRKRASLGVAQDSE